MHSLRLFRSLSLRRVQKRALFYEISRYSVADYEKKLIAQSKEAGGLHFLLQNSPNLEELWHEVCNIEEISSLFEYKLSHMIHFPRSASNSIQQSSNSLQSQLEDLSAILSNHALEIDRLSIHVPSSVLFEELQAKTLLTQTQLFQQHKLATNHTKIGYHLSTETLHSIPEHQVEEVAANLSNCGIGFLSLAVNPFTFKSAMSISQQLNLKFPIYAMEVLRCHPAIPGQVSANYEYLPPHIRHFDPESPTTENKEIPTNQSASIPPPRIVSSQSSNSLSEGERLGVHDLHMAFDRAITMEKALLTKHPEKVSELVTACVAHNLSRRHFQYLEEFDYLIESQVQSQFEKYSNAKDQDVSVKNWIILQRPILHYLFSSYRSFLASRQLDLSRSIAKIISSKVMSSAEENDSESLKWMPYRLAALAKQAVHAKDVGLTLTTVGEKESGVSIPQMTKEQIVEVYEEIGKVYKDHYHTEDKATTS